jgi:RHS repeat-associated protein
LASISGAVSASFQYDAFGRRVSKTIGGTSTGFLYDGANAVQELSGGTPTANMLAGGIDEYFQRVDFSGAASFLTDALGSTISLNNSAGTALASYTYDPFGGTTVTGSSSNSNQYTGRENDGTGLYYYRARYYNPKMGRFISEDPIGFWGSANFYAYTANSPGNWVDPFGTDKNRPAWLRFLRKVGDHIPVICGGGLYNTGGFQVNGGLATVTVRTIQQVDSRSGYQSAPFAEITIGEGPQVGYGQAMFANGNENYLFAGADLDVPLVSTVSLTGFVSHVEGDSYLSNSIGADLDASFFYPGASVAYYVNTDSLTSAIDHNFR